MDTNPGAGITLAGALESTLSLRKIHPGVNTLILSPPSMRKEREIIAINVLCKQSGEKGAQRQDYGEKREKG